MDGVLVDLASSVERVLNIQINEHFRHSTERYPHILEMMVALYETDECVGVFRDAELMSDAVVLWQYITQYSVEILSSTGPMFAPRIGFEKRMWVKKHKGNYKVNLVTESHLKAQYAAPNHILIDDQEKSIIPWQEAGGVGILHTNAENTIELLNQLGL